MSAGDTAGRPGDGRRAALVIVVALFAVDQATKLWVLYGLDLARGPVPVLPFMDFALVWNRGISYGLLQQEGAGRWLLVAFTAAAASALSVWMWRTRSGLTRIALALVVAGALGNLVDRIVYGAVVDFVHLYFGDFSWYVFNVADSAIVVGVVLLLIDGFLPQRRSTAG